jgi:hypothetical protein
MVYAAEVLFVQNSSKSGVMRKVLSLYNHLNARESQRSHQLLTPRMLSLPSLWPS